MFLRIGFLAILISAALPFLGGCDPVSEVTAASSKPIDCKLSQSRSVGFPIMYFVPGTVVSDDRIEIASRVVGFIQQIHVDEGQAVHKGQVLIQIDPKDVDASIQKSKATVESAKRELDDAKMDVEKYEKLIKSEAIAPETLRKAKVKRDVAEASLDQALSALNSAKAQQSYSKIKSPTDGVVIAKYNHVGDMATSGAPILTIESRRRILFRIFITESHISRIEKGMAVNVSIDALDQHVIKGRVLRIVPSGDSTTRRYQVEIELPNDSDVLFGMFGRASIPLGTEMNIAVPLEAKIERGGLEGVFVVDKSNVARFRWVRFGRIWNGLIAVTAGLSADTKIILNPPKHIRDGVFVQAPGSGASNE